MSKKNRMISCFSCKDRFVSHHVRVARLADGKVEWVCYGCLRRMGHPEGNES